jgi:hypothetical protein
MGESAEILIAQGRRDGVRPCMRLPSRDVGGVMSHPHRRILDRTPAEVGVDAFQADRVVHAYVSNRSARRAVVPPEGGSITRSLRDVIDHCNDLLKLALTDREKADQVERLKSLSLEETRWLNNSRRKSERFRPVDGVRRR